MILIPFLLLVLSQIRASAVDEQLKARHEGCPEAACFEFAHPPRRVVAPGRLNDWRSLADPWQA